LISEKKEQISNYASRAKEWLVRAINARLNYAPATNLMHYLVTDQHEFGRVVRLVAENTVQAWADVDNFIKNKLYSQKGIHDYISQANKELRGGPKTREIEGKAHKHLTSELLEIQKICLGWKSAVASLEEIINSRYHEPNNDTNLAEFRALYTENYKDVKAWLESIASGPASSKRMRVLAGKAISTFTYIFDLLQGHEEIVDHDVQQGCNLKLLEPLLLLPDYPLEKDNPEEMPSSLTKQAAGDLVDSYRRGITIIDAFDHHVKHKDFLAAKHILDILGDGRPQHLQEQYEDALLREQGAFKRNCAALSKKLEQAIIDHVLTESEKATMEAELYSLEKSGKEGCLKINLLLQRIDSISSSIDNLREIRKNSLQAELESFKAEIDTIEGETKERINILYQKTAEALEGGVLALADEYLVQMEGIVRYGKMDIADIGREKQKNIHLEQFLNIY